MRTASWLSLSGSGSTSLRPRGAPHPRAGKGTCRPRHLEACERIAPAEFERPVEEARLIVAHAGIGAVLTAARCGKPILLMPRRADLGEHRNDHQLATVRKLARRPGILVAIDEGELADRIREGLALRQGAAVQSPTALPQRGALAALIENRPLRPGVPGLGETSGKPNAILRALRPSDRQTTGTDLA